MAFLIENSGDGMPMWFAPRVARKLGAGAGWTGNKDEAIQFAREDDAQAFMECYLPNMAPFCTITRHEGIPA